MIRILRTPKKDPRILTYDLEWLPGSMRLRIAGLYDPKHDRYRDFRSIPELLDAMLTAEYNGAWFYAHAGGMADFLFLLPHLILAEEYRVTCIMAGGSAVVVRIDCGRYRWLLIDSYWTLRSPLSEIGETLGIPKGDCAFDAPYAELRDYNEQDTRILAHAIIGFRAQIEALGGELCATGAATSFNLFRRAYLRSDLITSPRMNDLWRNAVFGGRTEALRTGDCGSGRYFDITSSYPASMRSGSLPGRLLKTTRALKGDETALVDCTVRVPEDMYYPILPVRAKDKTIYPSGSFRGLYTAEELAFALGCGTALDKVHRVWTFEPFYDFEECVSDLFALRQRAGGYEQYALKIVINSIFGKTIEREEKHAVYIRPTARVTDAIARWVSEGRVRPPHEWIPGVLSAETIAKASHVHAPLGAYILARSRISLDKLVFEAGDSTVSYIDTDSVLTSSARDLERTPKDLGGVKRVCVFTELYVSKPKLYWLRHEGDGKITVRHKGVPPFCGCFKPYAPRAMICPSCGVEKIKGEGSQISKETFISYADGLHSVETHSMERVLSSIRSERPEPREKMSAKQSRETFPKRAPLEGGHTRPWLYREVA